jgi:hypothetical protein
VTDPLQEDEIVEVDPKRKVKFLNVQVKGSIDDYEVSLGKKKARGGA